MVNFIFFSINLSMSHYLNYEFCKLFLDKEFISKNVVLFCVQFLPIFYLTLHKQVMFCIKNSYFEIIVLVCSSMHILFYFILFTLFHMCFYFQYLLLILMNKFSGQKQINVSFCKIKYLDLYLSLIFLSFSFSYY